MSRENLVLTAVFFAVLILSAVISELIFRQRQIEARLMESDAEGDAFHISEAALADLGEEENRLIRRYYDVTRRDTNMNSMQNRLIRAGYFGQSAVAYFQVVRAVACLLALMAATWLAGTYLPDLSPAPILILGMFAGGIVFVLINMLLDRRGNAKERQYRRLFPDFMDMLIICLDAGMSLEAAANRVAREFVVKKQDFGLHLSIMMLEVRAGRRLRDALTNLSRRLKIDEARALAVLFRQSEELGTSVTQALRVFSKEMREMRIVRAEEKANALPIKMLLPLGAFLFPVSIVIVLVPIVIKVVTLVKGLIPH